VLRDNAVDRETAYLRIAIRVGVSECILKCKSEYRDAARTDAARCEKIKKDVSPTAEKGTMQFPRRIYVPPSYIIILTS